MSLRTVAQNPATAMKGKMRLLIDCLVMAIGLEQVASQWPPATREREAKAVRKRAQGMGPARFETCPPLSMKTVESVEFSNPVARLLSGEAASVVTPSSTPELAFIDFSKERRRITP